jgi:hypothetical protein
MASNKILNPNFDWGDIVAIKQIAPERYRPGSRGCICGIRTIDSIEVAKEFDQMIGSELYLIEFYDGKTFEIPKKYLLLSDQV